MVDNKNNIYNVNFNVEDVDALLQFPFANYALKEDEITDLPNLGIVKNLVINVDNSAKGNNLKGNLITNTQGLINPEDAYKESLALNIALQQKIVEGLNKIMLSQRIVDQYQSEIKQKMHNYDQLQKDIFFDRKHDKPISLFAYPYFRDVRDMVPPDNEDTIAKQKEHDITAFSQPPRTWSKEDKNKLIAGISANALSQVLKPYKIKRNHLVTKLKEQDLTETEHEAVLKQIDQQEMIISDKSKKNLAYLLEEIKGNLDWMRISTTSMEGSRTELECEIMWNNYLCDTINKTKFSSEEDEQLKNLVEEKFHFKKWDSVAKHLKTNRSAILCFQRYQSHLNEELVKKYWTLEEDEKLVNLINKYKVGRSIPWGRIWFLMPGRTRTQVVNRYQRTVAKDIKRAPWTTEEDAMLIACVKKFGCKWKKMMELIPGRSTYACRERYTNILEPSLKIGAWSIQEDECLISHIKKCGYSKWAKLSREMPGRTDNMVLVRAGCLKQHSILLEDDEESDEQTKSRLIKKLKPSAPTKSCLTANKRRRHIRDSAYSVLQSALENIRPSLCMEDMETLDMSSLPSYLLHRIHKYIYSREFNAKNIVWRPKYKTDKANEAVKKVLPRRSCTLKILNKTNDSDIDEFDKNEFDINESDIDEKTKSSEPKIDPHAQIFINKVLDAQFQNFASLLPMPGRDKVVFLNAKEMTECTIYQSYLCQNFFCQNVPGIEDNLTDVIIRKVNYSKSLNSVVHYFMQPPVSEDSIMVLAPNCTTMSGLEVMQGTNQSLKKCSQYVRNSSLYAKYLLGHHLDSPPCKKCKTVHDGQQEETFSSLLNKMKSNFIMSTETMKQAAILEAQCNDQDGDCACQELQDSKDAFRLFCQRLLSLFLWPSLLAQTSLNEDQMSLLHSSQPAQNFNFKTKNEKLITTREKKRKQMVEVKVQEEEKISELNSQNNDLEVGEAAEPPLKKNIRAASAEPIRKSNRSCVRNKRFCIES